MIAPGDVVGSVPRFDDAHLSLRECVRRDLLDDAACAEGDERQHDGLTALFERYFAEADAEIRLMEGAIRQDRAAKVEASASRLTCASVTIGADLVSPLAADLEARAQARDLNLAAHLVASLERALVQTSAALSGLPRPA